MSRHCTRQRCATKRAGETPALFPVSAKVAYRGEAPPDVLVEVGDAVEDEVEVLPREERLERPFVVEVPPEVVDDIEPVLPEPIEPLPIDPVEPIEPVDPIEPLPIDPVDDEPDGIAPGVPDCAPVPAPMLPLDCEAPIAPVAPDDPDAPAAPDAPAPPPLPPPADCASTATGVNATTAAMIIDFRMILSCYAMYDQPSATWQVPAVGGSAT